jgi:hypothetical protein
MELILTSIFIKIVTFLHDVFSIFHFGVSMSYISFHLIALRGLSRFFLSQLKRLSHYGGQTPYNNDKKNSSQN